MHQESYAIMKSFVRRFLDPNAKLDIVDVGSYDVNGTYRDLFANANWTYHGLDIVGGPNVDLISRGPYDFGVDDVFDVVISGNCLEHVEAPWLWIKEIEKITKPGGLICIVLPLTHPEHRFPVDCWRVLPDGFRYLLEKHCRFIILECRINTPATEYEFFNNRPSLAWVLRFIPHTIKRLIAIHGVQDTYAIARRIQA